MLYTLCDEWNQCGHAVYSLPIDVSQQRHPFIRIHTRHNITTEHQNQTNQGKWINLYSPTSLVSMVFARIIEGSHSGHLIGQNNVIFPASGKWNIFLCKNISLFLPMSAVRSFVCPRLLSTSIVQEGLVFAQGFYVMVTLCNGLFVKFKEPSKAPMCWIICHFRHFGRQHRTMSSWAKRALSLV
jgi:hypothetical protein